MGATTEAGLRLACLIQSAMSDGAFACLYLLLHCVDDNDVSIDERYSILQRLLGSAVSKKHDTVWRLCNQVLAELKPDAEARTHSLTATADALGATVVADEQAAASRDAATAAKKARENARQRNKWQRRQSDQIKTQEEQRRKDEAQAEQEKRDDADKELRDAMTNARQKAHFLNKQPIEAATEKQKDDTIKFLMRKKVKYCDDASTDVVQQVLDLLHKYYDPASVADKAHSLAISSGRNGARLSHNHQTQYKYIEQSLLLWREILSHLSQMWALAEGDLLDGRGYRLRDTGQGVHRVQGAPRVGRFMHTMLESMQEATRGGWVGSTAVHLGDNDVPNALVWIDKYSQIPRILAPVVSVVENLDEVVESTPGLPEYVKGVFGSVEACRKIILTDFFRHAFDGSGADNYYDAGSCIDGRLTSAWNWCSRISKKPYYHIFKMAGFVGFDGSFNK